MINIEGLEELKRVVDLEPFKGVFNVIGTVGVLAFFFAILFAIAIVVLCIFSCIGIMNLAKKKNLPNAWLAFLPIGRSYLIGKLGFEIYPEKNKKNSTFTWITLSLAAASFVLGNDSDGLNRLASIALLVFESMAFYNIFKVINPKNTTVYTVFTVLTDTLLGGIFLYLNKVEENIEEKENSYEEEKVQKVSNSKNNYCENCGTKISKTSKFCSECGKKINK